MGRARSFSACVRELLKRGELKELNRPRFPGYLSRSAPSDVARVEHLTYVCTRSRDDAGPNNNWMDPTEAQAKLRPVRGLYAWSHAVRLTLLMGPLDSPYSRCGVEITDSAYVVLNMAIMTRMGRAASSASPPTGCSCVGCTPRGI